MLVPNEQMNKFSYIRTSLHTPVNTYFFLNCVAYTSAHLDLLSVSYMTIRFATEICWVVFWPNVDNYCVDQSSNTLSCQWRKSATFIRRFILP